MMTPIPEHSAGVIPYRVGGDRTLQYATQFGLCYVKVPYQKVFAAGRSDLIVHVGGNSLFVIGEGPRDAQFANELVESGREVLLVLPEGIEPPEILKVQLLYRVPGRERLFQLLKPGA